MSDITGLPPLPPNDLRKTIELAKRTMKDQIELQDLVAQLDREKFKSMVKHGFTELQAIELMKAEKMRVRA